MPHRPSSWVNLQDYLGLNEDQGAEMGNRVYGDVAGQAQKAGEGIGKAEQMFDMRAKQGTLQGPDENAFNSSSNVYTAAQAGQHAAQGYTGPNSLSDIDQNIGSSVSDAVQRVQNAQTTQGLGSELQKTYGAQAASGTGGSALDSFLTGATSSEKLSGLKDSYGGLMDTLGLAEQNAQKRALQGKTESAASAKRWAELQPVLEEEARRQLAAKAAGARATAQQAFEQDLQQEQQYGFGGGFGHDTPASHEVDPRLIAYQNGKGAEYDAAHPPTGNEYAADWQGNGRVGDGTDWWEYMARGAPQPTGAERTRQYDAQRARSSFPRK